MSQRVNPRLRHQGLQYRTIQSTNGRRRARSTVCNAPSGFTVFGHFSAPTGITVLPLIPSSGRYRFVAARRFINPRINTRSIGSTGESIRQQRNQSRHQSMSPKPRGQRTVGRIARRICRRPPIWGRRTLVGKYQLGDAHKDKIRTANMYN